MDRGKGKRVAKEDAGYKKLHKLEGSRLACGYRGVAGNELVHTGWGCHSNGVKEEGVGVGRERRRARGYIARCKGGVQTSEGEVGWETGRE